MKIRVGFVSNSSTSSFCIYGCSMDQDEAFSFLLKAGTITKEQATDGEDEEYDAYDFFDGMATKNNIEYYSMDNYDGVWFGFDFLSIPDNVNVGEWKKEKEAELKKLFGNDIKCGIHSEAWQDM